MWSVDIALFNFCIKKKKLLSLFHLLLRGLAETSVLASVADIGCILVVAFVQLAFAVSRMAYVALR
jgi:hypothetical protein